MTFTSFIGVVGSAINGGASGGPPWNVPISTSVPTGGAVAVLMNVTNGNAPSSVTDSKGNSYSIILGGSGNQAYIAIGDIKNALVGGTDTISISPSWTGYIVRVLGFAMSGPIALRSGQASYYSFANGSVTAVAGDLIVAQSNGSGVGTPAAPWISVASGGNGQPSFTSGDCSYQVASAGGTVTYNPSNSTLFGCIAALYVPVDRRIGQIWPRGGPVAS